MGGARGGRGAQAEREARHGCIGALIYTAGPDMPNFFLCGGRFPSSTTLVFDPVPALASGVQFCDLFFAPRARAHVLVPFCTCVMHPTSQVRLGGLQTPALTSVLPGTFDSPYPSHLSFSPLTSLSVGFLSLSPFSFSFFTFF